MNLRAVDQRIMTFLLCNQIIVFSLSSLQRTIHVLADISLYATFMTQNFVNTEDNRIGLTLATDRPYGPLAVKNHQCMYECVKSLPDSCNYS